SDTDALIERLEKLIAKKKNIKQGAMQQLLTGKKRLPGFSGVWDVKKLGDVAEIKKGQLITDSTRIDGIIPVIAGGKTPAYYHNKANRHGKTITVSGSGASAGHVAFHTIPIFASDCSTIEESRSYSIEFIYFLLQSIQENIYKMQTGGAQPHIHPTELKSLLVIKPPISEQNAIATILSDTDALIDHLEKLIAKKKNIKQGAMQQLLTGKKRLPGFSGEWEVKKLGDVANVVGGGTPSTHIANYWNGSINWFTPTEIGRHKYTFHSFRKITKEGLKNCSARLLPKGTVLLTSRAGIGDISILMNEGCTNQGFQSLIANKDVSYEFLYYLVSTLKNVLIQNASGSTFLEISPNRIKQIEVIIPNLKEQSAIATILSDMDSEIEALEQKRDKYTIIKQGMMQQLLTGRIRVHDID
ncbi:MAG: restriction endonuclease subunit S, partial [Candidatus Heimdallarchaeota archaeon]|nr:restriction endonuclease subunit S [Candidatus Heimdallarchaeota archaeon]